MTCTDRVRDEVIDEMMADAGVWHAPDVKATLGVLAALATLKAPQPGTELAAVLSGGQAGDTTAVLPLASLVTPVQAADTTAVLPVASAHILELGSGPEHADSLPPLRRRTDELAERRRKRRNRSIVISVAVAATMGMGVSGVAAATGGFPQGSQFVQRLIQQWAPGWAPVSPGNQQLPAPDSPTVTSVPSTGTGVTSQTQTPQNSQGTSSSGSENAARPGQAPSNPPAPASGGKATSGDNSQGTQDGNSQGSKLQDGTDKAVKSSGATGQASAPASATSGSQSPSPLVLVGVAASTVSKVLPSLLGLAPR